MHQLLRLVAQMEMLVYQLDFKLAFLNVELKEEVYLKQPLGYTLEGKDNKVLRLKNALYGLKQAPRVWNNKIVLHFHQSGFYRSPSETFLYVKREVMRNILIVCLYVDDLIYTGTKIKWWKNSKWL